MHTYSTLVFAFLLFSFGVLSSENGQTIYVNDESSFQAAVQSNTTIYFTSDIDLNQTIVISGVSNLNIMGDGFTLNGLGRVNCFNVIDSRSVWMDEVVVLNGSEVDVTGDGTKGGGFNLEQANMEVHRSSFVGCSATFGGVFFVGGSTLKLVDCIFSNNFANLGGAIYSLDSFLFISHCLFSMNEAFVDGGAISAALFGTLTIDSSVLVQNTALGEGGGIYILNGVDAHFSNSSFIANQASLSGGAVSSEVGTVTLINCSMTMNRAGFSGGAMFAYSTKVVLATGQEDNSTMHSDGNIDTDMQMILNQGEHSVQIYNNSAKFDGGGFFIADAGCSIILKGGLLVFSHNVAGRDGGGLFGYEASITEDTHFLYFKHNLAGYSDSGGSGGAIYFKLSANQGALNLSDVVFESNQCLLHGGAMMVEVEAGTPDLSMIKCEVCGYDDDGTVDCLFIPTNSTWRKWNHTASIQLQRVSFVNNSAIGSGGCGGALSITNGNAVIEASTFTGNRASTLGGALYLPRAQYSEATAELVFRDVAFSENFVTGGRGSVLYSESASSLTFLDGTLLNVYGGVDTIVEGSESSSDVEFEGSGNVVWSADSGITCPAGYRLEQPILVKPYVSSLLPDWNNTKCLSQKGPCPSYFESCWPPMLLQSIAYNCTACPSDSYSLEAGFLLDNSIQAITCFQTPYGGDAQLGGEYLKAMPGFFGSLLHDPPTSSTTTSNIEAENSGESKNEDYEERQVLFVECPSGFCCQDDDKLCAWNETCAGHRTGILCGKCLPEYSISMLGANCVHNKHCSWASSLFSLELLKAAAYCLLFYTRPNIGFSSPFALVAFYDQFYNVLTVDSSSDSQQAISLLGFFFGSSNTLPFKQQSNLCAWPGMQPITRAFAPFVDIMAMLFILFIVWLVGLNMKHHSDDDSFASRSSGMTSITQISSSGGNISNLNEARVDSLDRQSSSMSTFNKPASTSQHLKRLAAAAAQAMNFSIGALASGSTQLLTCTDSLPGSKSRLLIDGEVLCFTTWQYLIMCLMCLMISIVCIPVVCGFIYAFGPSRTASSVSYVSDRIMQDSILGPVAKLATHPFKPQYWYWLSVMILQRICLAVIHVTIDLTATTRSLYAVAICVLFLVFQSVCHPFKLASYNTAQTFLLACTVVVASFNVVPSDMITNAMSTSTHMNKELDTIALLKSLLLVVPIFIVLSWWCYINRKDAKKLFKSTTKSVKKFIKKSTVCNWLKRGLGGGGNSYGYSAPEGQYRGHGLSFDESESTIIEGSSLTGPTTAATMSTSSLMQHMDDGSEHSQSSMASSRDSMQLPEARITEHTHQNFEYF